MLNPPVAGRLMRDVRRSRPPSTGRFTRVKVTSSHGRKLGGSRAETHWEKRGARCRTAFTLVELLVVIAIIAILVAMVLSALREVIIARTLRGRDVPFSAGRPFSNCR